MFRRAIVIVLDSVGIGEARCRAVGMKAAIRSAISPSRFPKPDAYRTGPPARWYDRGDPAAGSAAGCMAASPSARPGKTRSPVTGAHGDRPRAPVSHVPSRIPRDLIAEFEQRIGRKSLGNVWPLYGDHRRVRTAACRNRLSDCLYLRRQRVPNRRSQELFRCGSMSVRRSADPP